MSETRATRTILVTNPAGLHLRAATLLISLARRFDSRIEVIKDRERVDCKSTPLRLITLGAWQGDRLLLEATGSDAEEALTALEELFANNFEEESDQQQVGQGRLGGNTAENDLPAG